MIFQLLRRGTKRKPQVLHTITVIESAQAGFSLGPLLAQVTGRSFFDLRSKKESPPRIPNKVISVSTLPAGGSKIWGTTIDVEDIIKGDPQFSSQSVLRLAMLRLRDLADPWN